MEIIDRVYGRHLIEEPVIIELINSKPLQRLKGINQTGASKYAIKRRDVTRFEHSIGVMLLLKMQGASLEEQIAGLLHDTPHTVFSHVIDFVFKNNKHNFHEKFYEEIITNSEIPSILRKHGFKVKRILDANNFTLLERELPNLCADRIDYTLRDMAAYLPKNKADDYLSNLIVLHDEIIFDNKEAAKAFAEDFLMMDERVWSNPRETALYQILADAIKIALDKGIISEQDLFKEDDEIYKILKESDDEKIKAKIEMLNPKLKIIDNKEDYHFYSTNKLRYIDPKVRLSKDDIKRASEIYPELRIKLDKHKKRADRGNYIKIISF